ncbi:MAG: class I SAM-dependent methyltransferase [Marivibrio sp.]|uniref:class I SAM-dependent methyltransferase n=1 Tax=Marivibrio sp. TaxID=2039719 RepID=UPI0032F01D38
MSRLDSVIRRLKAQRACLNAAAERVAGREGVVLELGLGNGRTYDHLREILPERQIFVFEREVRAHPDCIPPDDYLYLGDVRDTLTRAAADLAGRAVLVHSDIGTGEAARNAALAAEISRLLPGLLAPGAVIVSDQALALPGTRPLDPPEGVRPGRYHMAVKG